MKSSMGVAAILCLLVAGIGSPAYAGSPILGVTGGSGGTPGNGTTHGWRFTANQAITLTDLGLYDGDDDGMVIDHPIGLFRFDTAELLTSGTIHAGTGDPLIDHFRYVDVEDVTLESGVDYFLSYYNPTANNDFVILTPTDLWIDSAITYKEARYGNGGLIIPPTVTTTYYRIGPNFLYTPEPTSICLLLAGGFVMLRRRG